MAIMKKNHDTIIRHIGNGFYYIIIEGYALMVRADDAELLRNDVEKDIAYYAKKAKCMGRKIKNRKEQHGYCN